MVTEKIDRTVSNSELIKALGVPQLIALLEGLEVPYPEWWIANQPPSAFMALGKELAGQAKLITQHPQRCRDNRLA